jgi:hypothetical protein
MLRLGGCLPPIELTANANSSFSDFSFSAKAHNIVISDDRSVTLSPFIGVNSGGVTAGSDLTFNLSSDLGVKLTGGYRNEGNPLNEIEGVSSGIFGSANVTYRFGRRR